MRKVARIPVTWKVSAVLEIPYVHAEELAELLKQVNLPNGKMIPESYEIDLETIDDMNKLEIIHDIVEALEELDV